MSNDVMRLALEVLRLPSMKTEKMLVQRDEAIEALEEALKQEQGEPVAYLHQCRKKPELKAVSFKKHEPELFAKGYKVTSLFDTTPQQRKPLMDEHAIFAGQCVFLDWNRKQSEPLVKIAYEYGVFQKAIEIYKEAAQGIKV